MRPADGGLVPFGPLVAARFVARPNRFLIVAQVGGRRVHAACRYPGRMVALLRPGAELRLAPASGPGRRTRFDAVLVRRGRTWISLVPVHANRIFEAAVKAGTAAGLRGSRILGREVAHGRSRLDFLIEHRRRHVLAEVKSVGLVQRGQALFPDAPTARGARHLRALRAHVEGGGRALVVFVVQRSDARTFSPHGAVDPAFTAALRAARRAGVRVLAYNCRMSPRGSALARPIAVVVPRA